MRIEESSGNANRRFLQERIERKSRHNTSAHFTSTRVAREGATCTNDSGEFQEIESNYSGKDSSRSQSTGSHSKSSICNEARPNHAILIHGVCLKHREMFLAINVQCLIQHRHLIKDFSLYESKCHRCGSSAGKYRATCRKRSRTKREHDLNADVCKKKKPSTLKSFSPAEIPQNAMAVQQRLQISELQFDKYPTPSSFSSWKMRFQNPGEFLFRFSLTSNVMDQISGDVDSVDEF